MDKNKVKQGKINRKKGREFEKLVQKDLESKGWIVARWTKNIEFDDSCPDKIDGCLVLHHKGKLIDAKSNRFNMRTCGFPDFICYKIIKIQGIDIEQSIYAVVGVECKSNGYLDKEEREKCKWLIENKIFEKILIASKDYPKENINLPQRKRKIIIKYKEFENEK
jgi:hypothetical protein